MLGLDKAQGSVKSAGGVILSGSDELYESDVFSGGDTLYLLDEQLTHASAASVLGNDEHRHLEHGVAVSKVRFDPEVRRPYDAVLSLHYENPRPRFLQKLAEPRLDRFALGPLVSQSVGEIPGQSVDSFDVPESSLAHGLRRV